VYFVLLFINLPSFPPVSRTVDADNTISIREPHGHDRLSDTANAIVSLFFRAVIDIRPTQTEPSSWRYNTMGMAY
jgi:hypothetical protein